MGFFDKVKNMFIEEVEEDDVKVEQIKNEVTKVTIDSPKKDNNDDMDLIIQNEIREEKISKPVFFDDNDFRDLNLTSNTETKKEEKEEKEIYGVKVKEEKEEKKVFKPTPIISPVYGILDKNYHKEDIVSRDEVKNIDTNTDLSIDSIRDKAYGTLEDELENTLFGRNSILFKNDEETNNDSVEITEVSDDILTNLTDDISRELDELLIKKEKYSDDDLKVNMKSEENLSEDDLLEFIDSTLYKEGDEE